MSDALVKSHKEILLGVEEIKAPVPTGAGSEVFYYSNAAISSAVKTS